MSEQFTAEEVARDAWTAAVDSIQRDLSAIGAIAEIIRKRDAEVRREAYRDLWAHCYDDGDAAATVGGFALVTRELGRRAGHGGPELDRYCEQRMDDDHDDAFKLGEYALLDAEVVDWCPCKDGPADDTCTPDCMDPVKRVRLVGPWRPAS